MPMFLVTFMALLFWIATWLTIQIECEPFRRRNTGLRPVRKAECNSAGRTDLEVYVPRPTWLTSKSERLFSAEAPRIRKGPQLQAAGLRPRINAAMRTPQKPGPRLRSSYLATVERAVLFK
jgi:hypothetical protein